MTDFAENNLQNDVSRDALDALSLIETTYAIALEGRLKISDQYEQHPEIALPYASITRLLTPFAETRRGKYNQIYELISQAYWLTLRLVVTAYEDKANFTAEVASYRFSCERYGERKANFLHGKPEPPPADWRLYAMQIDEASLIYLLNIADLTFQAQRSPILFAEVERRYRDFQQIRGLPVRGYYHMSYEEWLRRQILAQEFRRF